MSSLSIGHTQHASWRELYLMALFEPDKMKAVDRIMEAERALVVRERELFRNPQDAAEREAVNRALQGLHALRACIRTVRSASAA